MISSASRREFLVQSGKKTAAITAAISTLGGVHAQSAETPAVIKLGLIGCGGQMGGLVRRLTKRPGDVSFASCCDVDPGQIDRMTKIISGFQSSAPKRTARYEEVIRDPNVDAVFIATPHHWHAPMALAALRAGKDIYIEKPMSHVYREGQLIADAAKKYGRVVQHGTQMRSSPVREQAARLLADGIIGEVKVARAWTAEKRRITLPVADSQPPADVDYERWLGPAPLRKFNSQRFHRTWRWFRDYGNGEIGDDGVHDVDMARWGLGDPDCPTRITARGGRMMLHGHFSEYPDNMTVTYEYPDGRLLIYENYPFTQYGMHGYDNGNVFYGTEGYMVFSRRGAFNVYLGPKAKPGPKERKETRSNRGYDENMDNFLTAVRNRSDTNASAEVAHRSCALVHFGNIANETRGQLEFDVDGDRFVDCDEANELLTKNYRSPYRLPAG